MGEQGPLRTLVEPTLEDLGFDLVRLLLMGKQRRILQIMAERRDGDPITVEDCEAISRSLSAVLDVADPIQGAFDLEVSSPGMDRPLTRRKDFARFAGFEARFESDLAVDGRRRVKGRLKGITDDDTVIVAPAEPGPDGSQADWAVPLAALVKAKLVLTDALIDHAMKADKATREDDAPQTGADES
ncbi:ribosome maturation factor RimP [Roseospira navarrensis]|uniref:Ribosome maturation factor RimP n=2 Tax=Roseospira navarrensis TaxID=140058 RepID=A0A7X1ZJH4_9PROT|nr:ribosome maturation factor RimP [Roseospira navarrensis]MQX38370.1 ribosome maturation factor RimP [Roseospira navarrensis]